MLVVGHFCWFPRHPPFTQQSQNLITEGGFLKYMHYSENSFSMWHLSSSASVFLPTLRVYQDGQSGRDHGGMARVISGLKDAGGPKMVVLGWVTLDSQRSQGGHLVLVRCRGGQIVPMCALRGGPKIRRFQNWEPEPKIHHPFWAPFFKIGSFRPPPCAWAAPAPAGPGPCAAPRSCWRARSWWPRLAATPCRPRRNPRMKL